MSSLAFTDLAVHYGTRTALAGFTDTVRPGEWLCLIGPNGAGKSSILRSVAGLVPHTGSIEVDGSRLELRSARRRAELVAYVPQSPVLPDDMTGAEYVLLGRNPYISYFGAESAHDRALVAELLDRLDLGELAGRYLGTMSGGERQRLVIARALGSLPVVMELAAPLIAPDGTLVAWRGRRDADDAAAAARAGAELGLERAPDIDVTPIPGVSRHFSVWSKVGPTPDRYPRRPGMAAKRPLA